MLAEVRGVEWVRCLEEEAEEGKGGAEKGARECVLSTKTPTHNSRNTCFSY